MDSDFVEEENLQSQAILTKRELSSAGLEHLPYKQRVGGSNPSAPTKVRPLIFEWSFFDSVASLLLRPSESREGV